MLIVDGGLSSDQRENVDGQASGKRPQPWLLLSLAHAHATAISRVTAVPALAVWVCGRLEGLWEPQLQEQRRAAKAAIARPLLAARCAFVHPPALLASPPLARHRRRWVAMRMPYMPYPGG
jgi:hypothetical protein